MKKMMLLIPLVLFSCKKDVPMPEIDRSAQPLQLIKNIPTKIGSVTEQSNNSFGMLTFTVSDSTSVITSNYYFDNLKKNEDSTYILIKKANEDKSTIQILGYFPNNGKQTITTVNATTSPVNYSADFNNKAQEYTEYTSKLIESEHDKKLKPKHIPDIKNAGLNNSEQPILEKIPKSITYDWMAKRYDPYGF